MFRANALQEVIEVRHEIPPKPELFGRTELFYPKCGRLGGPPAEAQAQDSVNQEREVAERKFSDEGPSEGANSAKTSRIVAVGKSKWCPAEGPGDWWGACWAGWPGGPCVACAGGPEDLQKGTQEELRLRPHGKECRGPRRPQRKSVELSPAKMSFGRGLPGTDYGYERVTAVQKIGVPGPYGAVRGGDVRGGSRAGVRGSDQARAPRR